MINIKTKSKVLIVLSVFLILAVFMASVSAVDDNAALGTDEAVDQADETLAVEGSSAGTTDDDSGLKELDDGNKSTKNLLGATNDKEILGSTITVDGNTFLDIQNAIDSATAEDTIYLNSQIYTGSGSEINIDKSLTIIGSEGCTLDAQGQSRIFNVAAADVTFKNITLINGRSSADGGAIYTETGNVTVSGSTFVNNTARYGGAICSSSSNVTIASVFPDRTAPSQTIASLFS